VYGAGVAEPRILYEPVLLGNDDVVFYQAGAFSTEAEALKVLEVWRAEGRREAMALNLVTLYETAEEWQANR
jgi:hypothetical protein